MADGTEVRTVSNCPLGSFGYGVDLVKGERVEGEWCLDLHLQREHSGLQEYFMYDNNKCTLHTYDTYRTVNRDTQWALLIFPRDLIGSSESLVLIT